MRALDPFEISLFGTSLIEASAGTGKTHTLTTLFLRLLLERDLRVDEILVVTYTRAATAELRGRIRERLVAARSGLALEIVGDDPVLESLRGRLDGPGAGLEMLRRLDDAISGFDEASIYTIHGFCEHALQEHAFESGVPFEVEFIADQDELVEDVANDFHARLVAREDELLLRFLRGEKIDVESFRRLASSIGLDPRLRLLPESGAPNPAPDFGAWQKALDAVRSIWERDADDVIQLVRTEADGGALKASIYQKKTIDSTWRPTIDALVQQALPGSFVENKVFAKLRPAKLRAGTKKDQTPPQHPFFDACDELAEHDEALRKFFLNRVVELRRELIADVRIHLASRKAAAGVQSFDDLLVQLHAALHREGGDRLAARIGQRTPVALIDEFQDTDTLQYGILERVWHHPGAPETIAAQAQAQAQAPALMLIGDPKQAIYRFRGADVFAYLEARRDAGDSVHTLVTNWRSDPSLIRAVNHLFQNVSNPFLLEEIEFEPVEARPGAEDPSAAGAPFEFLTLTSESIAAATSTRGKAFSKELAEPIVARRTAAEISRLIDSKETIDGRVIGPGDIAILSSKNAHNELLRGALTELGIPAVVMGGASVYDSVEAGELERILRAVADPGSSSSLRAALATPVFGCDALAIDALRSDELQADRWNRRFREWHRVWQERGFTQAFQRLLVDTDAHPRLLRTKGGERRLTNLLHLAELLQRISVDEHLGITGLVERLAQLRASRSSRDRSGDDPDLLRLESDSQAVTLVTIHKSKGLQYPIVYCPFLWDARKLWKAEKWISFHDPEANHHLTLDIGSGDFASHVPLLQRERMAESLRLLYVALTRARHRCVVVWGWFSGCKQSPLSVLLHPASDAGAVEKSWNDFANKSEGDVLADLQTLAADSDGAIAVRELAPDSATRPLAPDAPRPLARRVPTRRLEDRWRHSSFTALTASRSDARANRWDPIEEAFDHDAISRELPAVVSREPESVVALDRFPAGASAGILMHSVLEGYDFAGLDRLDLSRRVAAGLDEHGFDAGLESLLSKALVRAIETRWDDEAEAFSLSSLDGDQRLDEMEFLLPVAGDGASPLTVTRLADVFAKHAEDDFVRGYAADLRSLHFLPLEGYLKGFVDLVYRVGDRYFVVDYKSNHLGPHPENYLPDRLMPVMADHHYVLQYHLYLVALHRHLATRLPDYDYERNIGGVAYLFLRGMAPEHPAGCGIHRDRPPGALIEALSGLFEKPGGAR